MIFDNVLFNGGQSAPHFTRLRLSLKVYWGKLCPRIAIIGRQSLTLQFEFQAIPYDTSRMITH